MTEKPCKICSKSVSKKNGIRCQGYCKKWTHYACLNYTALDIHNIKSGNIKLECPCLECLLEESSSEEEPEGSNHECRQK